MKINYTEFKKVFEQTGKFMSNSEIGVMLSPKESGYALVYSDNRQAIYGVFPAEFTEEERALGNFVVDYLGLKTAMEQFSSTGSLLVKEIEADLSGLSESNTITLKVDKVRQEEEEGKLYETVVSSLKKTVKAFLVDNVDNRYKIVARFDADACMFSREEYDTWQTKELSQLLGSLGAGDDSRNCYISTKKGVGFVVTQNSMICLSLPDGINFGFAMTGKVAKSLGGILGKIPSETVRLSVTGELGAKSCAITTEDESFGVWFMLASPRMQDADTLTSYRFNGNEVREYNRFCFKIATDGLRDMVRACQSGTVQSPTTVMILDFNSTDGMYTTRQLDNKGNIVAEPESEKAVLRFGESKSGSNTMYAFYRVTGEVPKDELKLGVSLKALTEVLSVCTHDTVILGIEEVDATRRYLRVQDADAGDNVYANMYLLATLKG